MLPLGIDRLCTLGRSIMCLTVVMLAGAAPATAALQATPAEIFRVGFYDVPLGDEMLVLTSSAGPLTWSAHVDASWLSLDHEDGTTPDTIVVRFATTGPRAGQHATDIVFVVGGDTLRVPVEYAFDNLDLVDLVTDYERPVVYGLHQGGNSWTPTMLLFIRPSDGVVMDAVEVGDGAPAMALSVGEGRVYVSNLGDAETRAVDVETREHLPSVEIGDDVQVLSAGRPGRLYVEGSGLLRVHDSQTGAQMGSIPLGAGDAAIDPSGRFYYHYPGRFRTAVKYDVSTDVPQLVAESGRDHLPGSPRLALSGDGQRVFVGRHGFDTDLNEIAVLFSSPTAMSLHGDYVVGGYRVFRVRDATLLGEDLHLLQATMSGDQQWIVWTWNGRLGAAAMANYEDVPEPALNAKPVHCAWAPNPVRFSWDRDGVAFRWSLYVGQDSGAVAAADTSSVLHVATVDEPRFELDGLPRYVHHWWRLDLVSHKGTTIGTTRRFQVSPVDVDKQTISGAAALGLGANAVDLQLSTDERLRGVGLVPADPWLVVVDSDGRAPGSARLSFDASGLDPGFYRTTLGLLSGSVQFEIPVSLRVFAPDPIQLLAHPEERFVYALHAGSDDYDDGFLLRFDASSQSVDHVMPIGMNPRDMALHAEQGRLYVTNWYQRRIRVVEVETMDTLAAVPVRAEVQRVAAGRSGRVVTGEAPSRFFRIVDTATGIELDRESQRGDGVANPEGTRYYHAPDQSSFASIIKYDIAGDTFEELVESSQQPPGSANLVMSGDGSRLFWQGFVYDTNLVQLRQLGEPIHATNRSGQLAFSATQMYDATTGMALAQLPVQSTVMAVTSDQQELIYFDGASRVFGAFAIDVPVSALMSVAEVVPIAEGFRIVWYSSSIGQSVTVERKRASGAWARLARLTPDARGRFVLEDVGLRPDERYDYRILVDAEGGPLYVGHVSARTPKLGLALVGTWPHPVPRTGARIVFTLDREAAATLALVDVAGRVVWKHSVVSPRIGRHTTGFPPGLSPGRYFLRLEQMDRAKVRSISVIR